MISPAHLGTFLLDDGREKLFNEKSIESSRKLGKCMKEQAAIRNFDFIDAADYVEASKEDGVHLDAKNHIKLAETIAKHVESIL